MVKIKYNGTSIEFPSEYTELTLGQLDHISTLFESDNPELIQWVDIVSYLSGLPSNEVETWKIDDFLGIINNMFIRIPKVVKVDIIELDGFKFKTPEQATLSVRQTALIEKSITGNDKFAQILTILLKQVDTDAPLTKSEQVELFSKAQASIFLPTLMKFGMQYVGDVIQNVKSIKDNHEVKAIN